jgi:hypothetical protein
MSSCVAFVQTSNPDLLLKRDAGWYGLPACDLKLRADTEQCYNCMETCDGDSARPTSIQQVCLLDSLPHRFSFTTGLWVDNTLQCLLLRRQSGIAGIHGVLWVRADHWLCVCCPFDLWLLVTLPVLGMNALKKFTYRGGREGSSERRSAACPLGSLLHQSVY